MFIQNLRAATAECHQRLELNNLSLALLSATVNEAVYCTYLSRLFSFVKGFEQFVYPILQPYFLHLNTRKKSNYLVDDLHQCGHSSTEIICLPQSFFKETYSDIYSSAGALYVLEGSTLGGQIIVKHLQKYLPATFNGSAYFSAYQKNTGTMWKAFLQQLTALPASHFEEQQIITGAKKTFETINNLLTNISPKDTLQ